MRRFLDPCSVYEVEGRLILVVIIGILAAGSELGLVLVVVVLLVVASRRSGPVTDLAKTVALAERLIRHILEGVGEFTWSPAWRQD